MTVKELHTFTDADMETIDDALKIADAQYRALAEIMSSHLGFRAEFYKQAHAAAQLRLKIETAR